MGRPKGDIKKEDYMKTAEDFFLEGRKVYLRQYKELDIKYWYRWFNDADVTKHMDQGRFPNTYSKQSEYLKKMLASSGDLQLAIVYKNGNRLVGTVGLHSIDYINRNADISIIIGDKKYWGKKIGKEAVYLLVRHAFNSLNLHKLTAGMVENNKASYKLFASLGFKKEGLLKDQVYLYGNYMNVIRLGLLKKFED